MIRISPEDTKWAIAAKVAATELEEIARQLPKELQGKGSKVVVGQGWLSALLVFGDLPSERLAKLLLISVTPVYLLDFDDDAPSIVKLERTKTRATEARVDEHPADFLKGHGIVPPGYAAPMPIRNVGLVEGITIGEARKAMPPGEFELRAHPRGVLVNDAPAAGDLAEQVGKRAYLLFHNPEDGDFSCFVQEPDNSVASYSPRKPSPNFPPLDNVLGQTTPDGILRVLEIPEELLGFLK